MADVPETPVCPACGAAVPGGRFCVRCGAPLAAGAPPRGYAASPDEQELVPFLASSLFPRLPRASMRAFRIALAVGMALVVVLGAAGLYPVAVAAAAVVVPVLTAIYLYDVDVYEDEPLRVLVLTALWGAAAGVAAGLIGRAVAPSGVDLLSESTGESLLVHGLGLTLLALALALAGPLVLLPYRKFNDALDGATFGGVSAVWLAGAQLLVHSSALFNEGLRPVGAVAPWILRLLELTVVVPVLWASVVGATAGAFWLRYRAPVRERTALGLRGRPYGSLAAAAIVLVLGSVVQTLLPQAGSLPVLAALAAGALVWLRLVIHAGLVQEAQEIALGPALTCANCGEETPAHTFCASCGISLRALPKAREEEAYRSGAARSRLRSGTVIGLGGGAAVAVAAVTVLVVALRTPGPRTPDCLPGEPCGGPPESSPPLLAGTRWASGDGAFALEYDGARWQPVSQSDRSLQLALAAEAGNGDAILSIDGSVSGDVQAVYDEHLDELRGRFLDLTQRRDVPLFGPNIGYRDGIGSWYEGTTDTPQGPGERVLVALLAAGDGVTSVVASAAFTDLGTGAPLAAVDSVLNTVVWLAPAGTEAPAAAPVTAAGETPSPDRKLGPTDPREQIELALALALPGAPALERFVDDVQDPGSPEYRRRLSAAQLGDRFGLPLVEIERLRSTLEAAGLEVLGASPQRTTLRARGSAELVSALFGVSLRDFVTSDGARYHAPDTRPSIPAGLEHAVTSVLGLSSEPAVRHPHAVPTGGLRPIDAARAYGVEPLWRRGIRGQGQTVAVVSFDSFREEDIAEYDRLAGIEDAPEVRRARVRGGAPLGRNAIEVSLDIEVVRSIAPRARIVSYEAPNSILSWPELLGRIVADGDADVVSVSWGNCEPVVDADVRAAAERELQLLAAQGVSVFVASGDRGAYDCFDSRDVTLPENRLEVTDWPASSPYVIAVGGTRLSVRQNGGYLAEDGWEDSVSWSGTGGGLSSSASLPAWQRGPGVSNEHSNGMRQVPDVAGPADCDSAFFIVYPLVNRQGDVLGTRKGAHGCGTSAAAPFWAGVAALLRHYADSEGVDGPGFLAPILYELAATPQPYPPFHDVTRGGNLKLNATPGWDYATGLGSPDVWNLARDVVAHLRAR